MHYFIHGSALLLLVPLGGCTLRANKQASAPAPPKPAAVQAPAPDPQLSIPQTAVVLPSPQPLNEDAIPVAAPVAQAPAPEKAPVAPPPTRTVRRAPAGPKPEPENDPEPAAAPPVEEQPAFRPILNEDAERKIKSDIESRKRDIYDRLSRARAHQTKANQALINKISSFLTQSDQAAQRGDFKQADDLSDKALILAKELQIE
ncbi:MAG TPA: hypothetical protein VKR61_21100 [Bryobacteraceae bacterium]|nr:hypothetical protein [Bryobacteraceae bacterium]